LRAATPLSLTIREIRFRRLETLGLRVDAGEIDAAFERCSAEALDALSFAHSGLSLFIRGSFGRFSVYRRARRRARLARRPIEAVGLMFQVARRATVFV